MEGRPRAPVRFPLLIIAILYLTAGLCEVVICIAILATYITLRIELSARDV